MKLMKRDIAPLLFVVPLVVVVLMLQPRTHIAIGTANGGTSLRPL